MDGTVAVFDVGKTNKKLTIFDSRLRSVDKRYRSFESRVVDGIELEPIEEIREWLLDSLADLARSHRIEAVGITTHGAGVVTVDNEGAIACPVVSYTHIPPEDIHDRFFAAVGDRDELQRSTATIELKPLINPAKLLFFTQEMWPDEFARIRHILFFPQYFAWVLTGKASADYTYVGCHSYLWDFHAWSWSGVTDALGIRAMVAEAPWRSWEAVGTIRPTVAERTGISPETPVTVGIHDSNASLLPYLLKKKGEDFVLNSTGTWCVAMNPGPLGEGMPAEFEGDEIGKSVFFNISAFGRPVKTTILMGGLEFGTYTEILKDIHKTDTLPDFNKGLYQRIIDRRRHFIVPGVVPGTGQFPDSRARVVDGEREYALDEIRSGAVIPPLFQDLPVSYAVLNLSIALQSKVALQRVGLTPGMSIFVEGGFRHNLDYNLLLAAFFPDNPIFLTGIEEATSFGTALTAWAARDGEEPERYTALFEIETFPVRPESFRGITEYEKEFFSHI
ncbi:MAG: carbohydrate kinase [Spirochaetales bacterium]|nr:carbohydrate kinase [Spirochaetales bacterium]